MRERKKSFSCNQFGCQRKYVAQKSVWKKPNHVFYLTFTGQITIIRKKPTYTKTLHLCWSLLLYHSHLNFFLFLCGAHTIFSFPMWMKAVWEISRQHLIKFYFNINYLTLNFRLQLITTLRKLQMCESNESTGHLARSTNSLK